MSREPDEVIWLGKNNYKYTFGICRFGEIWHGFASGELKDGNTMIFFFTFDGVEEKEEALKKTVAYAEMPEHGYGGISQFVLEFDNQPEIKNARAKDFPCVWGHPLCDGNCESWVEDDGDFVV